jgi:hypothetical protein
MERTMLGILKGDMWPMGLMVHITIQSGQSGWMIGDEFNKEIENFHKDENGTPILPDNYLLSKKGYWYREGYWNDIPNKKPKAEKIENKHEYPFSDDVENSPQRYGFNSWEEMTFHEAFGGDIDAWNSYNE